MLDPAELRDLFFSSEGGTFMSNAQKKVIVRRFSGDLLAGYLAVAGFVRHEPQGPCLDLLDLGGRIVAVPLQDIKIVSYVRDFNLGDTGNPERLLRRSFLARPRTEGLWLRLTFSSGDQLEGLAPTDLSLISSALEDAGLFLTPPDIRSNTQRLFVPRSAITEMQLIAVITSPSRKKPSLAEAHTLQDTLFPSDSRPN